MITDAKERERLRRSGLLEGGGQGIGRRRRCRGARRVRRRDWGKALLRDGEGAATTRSASQKAERRSGEPGSTQGTVCLEDQDV